MKVGTCVSGCDSRIVLDGDILALGKDMHFSSYSLLCKHRADREAVAAVVGEHTLAARIEAQVVRAVSAIRRRRPVVAAALAANIALVFYHRASAMRARGLSTYEFTIQHFAVGMHPCIFLYYFTILYEIGRRPASLNPRQSGECPRANYSPMNMLKSDAAHHPHFAFLWDVHFGMIGVLKDSSQQETPILAVPSSRVGGLGAAGAALEPPLGRWVGFVICFVQGCLILENRTHKAIVALAARVPIAEPIAIAVVQVHAPRFATIGRT